MRDCSNSAQRRLRRRSCRASMSATKTVHAGLLEILYAIVPPAVGVFPVRVAESCTTVPVTTGPRFDSNVLTVGLATMCNVTEQITWPPGLSL